jgi:hypothetical protein
MRVRLWRGKRRSGLAEVRRHRAAAERDLAEVREHVIIPLRKLREEDHVSEAITMLIQRRAQQERP